VWRCLRPLIRCTISGKPVGIYQYSASNADFSLHRAFLENVSLEKLDWKASRGSSEAGPAQWRSCAVHPSAVEVVQALEYELKVPPNEVRQRIASSTQAA
jgi:hypothetical protein